MSTKRAAENKITTKYKKQCQMLQSLRKKTYSFSQFSSFHDKQMKVKVLK